MRIGRNIDRRKNGLKNAQSRELIRLKNTKVCVFCESWETGGIESFLSNVLCSMNLSDMEIDIVTARLKQSVFSERISALGVNFKELSGSQRALFKNYKMFRRLLKERRYDVIHLNAFHALSFVYGAMARKYGVKKRIAHSHNTALRSSPTRPIKLALHNLCKWALRGAFTELWACSSAAAGFMFPKKAVASGGYKVVLNGIDADKFAFDADKRKSFRDKLGLKDETLVVNIGRLCEQKNQRFLLDAAKALADRKAKFKLLLVGDGDMSDELKSRAEQLGVSDKVIFYGTTDDVPGVLCAADVLAFPGLFEGLGIAAVEAQAADLPVVCSENIPSEAFVTDRMSAVPLSEGTEKWADALLENSRADRSADAVSAIKKRGYDIREIAADIENSYRKRV